MRLNISKGPISKGQLFACVAATAFLMVLSTPGMAQDIEIFGVDADWRFLDLDGFEDPEDVDPDFDSTWFTTGYDDSDWDGPAAGPFAYGTINGFGNFIPVALLEPFDGERFSKYFRLDFTTDEPYSNLAINSLTDDGAVFYLDGEEVLRTNCCIDDLGDPSDGDYFDFANAVGNEDGFSTSDIMDGETLPAGDHVFAVSVHQANTTSSDLGFGMSFLSLEPLPPNAVIIETGIDTTLAELGLNGPDGAHGAAGTNPDGVERWEFDGDDAGGVNHGLLWFDIPQGVLNAFGDGTALLNLHVDNNGHEGELHRMTVDWLSGPNGGDEVTWNNIPGGPGVFPGDNAEEVSNATMPDSIGRQGEVFEIDVTDDVRAWAMGQPNYGWGFVPIATATDGAGITSFENLNNPVPQLVIIPGEDVGPFLQAGDADQDLDFDQLDIVRILSAAKYRSGLPATWGEGDWDGAPGGSPGSPPPGNGFFDQIDIIAALTNGLYLQGPYAALAPGGSESDEQTSLVYDAATGELKVDAPASTDLTSIFVTSASNAFIGDKPAVLDGPFDSFGPDNIFKSTIGGSFGDLSLGNVLPAGWSSDQVAADLSASGSLDGGGGLGEVDLIYVPEPTTIVMLCLGAVGLIAGRRRFPV